MGPSATVALPPVPPSPPRPRASARDHERMDLIGVSEREYWANVAKRPGMFVGRTTLTGLEAYLTIIPCVMADLVWTAGASGWWPGEAATAITHGPVRSAISRSLTDGSPGSFPRTRNSKSSSCFSNCLTSSSQNERWTPKRFDSPLGSPYGKPKRAARSYRRAGSRLRRPGGGRHPDTAAMRTAPATSGIGPAQLTPAGVDELQRRIALLEQEIVDGPGELDEWTAELEAARAANRALTRALNHRL